MRDPVNYRKCLLDNLTERGYGAKKINDFLDRFDSKMAGFKAGPSPMTASADAMASIIKELEVAKAVKVKATLKQLDVTGDIVERLERGKDVNTRWWAFDGGSGQGVGVARGAISTVEFDPRFQNHKNFVDMHIVYRGQLWSAMSDVLMEIGKGAFGRQLGKASLDNIVHELFGKNTGDALASQVAKAFTKAGNLGVDLFNAVGGTMGKLADFAMPQSYNVAKVAQNAERFKTLMNESVDWTRMRYPDGAPIPVDQRARALDEAVKTITTGGLHSIDVRKPGGGVGRSVGNAVDEHRFFIFKDGEAWLNVHSEFGDGNVFDVMAKHLDDFGRRIALVDVFGTNPKATIMNIRARALKIAANISPEAVNDTQRVLRAKFDPMVSNMLRDSPVDASHIGAAAVSAVSNVLTSAMLGGASLLAVTGDTVTAMWTRAFNKQGLNPFQYLKDYMLHAYGPSAATRPSVEQLAQFGFVFDNYISSIYDTHRFNPFGTYGPTMSKHLADVTLRASLLNTHTDGAKMATVRETMFALYNTRDVAFDQHPFKLMFERYGITAADWDAMRQHGIVDLKLSNLKAIAPAQILQADIAGKDEIFRKFQVLVLREASNAVPNATMEAAAMLRGSERPDTLRGVLLQSFGMFKNFPITLNMQFARLLLTRDEAMTRLGYGGALIAGLTLAGGLGVQMREMAQGRDPMPWDSPKFMGRALLSGGGLSLWGDWIFGGINGPGGQNGSVSQLAGPLASFVGDTLQLALGDVSKWVDALGSLKAEPDSKFGKRFVEYTKRYTPGSNLWWSRLAIERNVFDNLAFLADPKYYKEVDTKMKKTMKDKGQGYWWTPGQSSPSRMPNFGNTIRGNK